MTTAATIAVVGGLSLAGVLIAAAMTSDQDDTGLQVHANLDAGVGGPASSPGPDEQLLHARHPLYRRPVYPGYSRDLLCGGGWAWLLQPPSEYTVA